MKTILQLPSKTKWFFFRDLILSILVGFFSAFAAFLFIHLIGFFQNLLFSQKWHFQYEIDQIFPTSVWAPLVIIIPAGIGLVVVWLTKTFAPETTGDGVPEVMNAVQHKQGNIKSVVVFVKSLASSITIGSGGSAGQESPVVYICSAIGSALGQWFHLNKELKNTLIAAGASAGIAATFNTPLGGLVFAFELILQELKTRHVMIVILSTVTATYFGYEWIRFEPVFNFKGTTLPFASIPELLLYPPLGVLIGLGCVFFIRTLYVTENFFNRLFKNAYLKHFIGMLCVGVILYAMFLVFDQYYVAGVGYYTVVRILQESLTDPRFLLFLFFLKVLTTSLTLGTGGSGGIFSPSLYLGATLGASYYFMISYFYPNLEFSVVHFALSGMAAFLSGVTGATLMGSVIVFELTQDYRVILPVLICTAIANRIRFGFLNETVYTLKLLRRGISIRSP